MKPATNRLARKARILIPILVVIPLMGLGLYIVPNLLDTTPPTLIVIGLEWEPLDKPRDPTSIGEWWSTGRAVAPEEWTERDLSSPVTAQLSLPSGRQR